MVWRPHMRSTSHRRHPVRKRACVKRRIRNNLVTGNSNHKNNRPRAIITASKLEFMLGKRTLDQSSHHETTTLLSTNARR